MVSSDLSSYGSLSSPSRLGRLPLMNVPFEHFKSSMKIYRTPNNYEHLTHQTPLPKSKWEYLPDSPPTLPHAADSRPCDANVASVQGRACSEDTQTTHRYELETCVVFADSIEPTA